MELSSVPCSSYHLGDCQNYGPFLGPYYNTGPNTGPSLGDPKRDHNFDNPPLVLPASQQGAGDFEIMGCFEPGDAKAGDA